MQHSYWMGFSNRLSMLLILKSYFYLDAMVRGQSLDVIIRTKNSEEFLECLRSIYEEIPVRRIIVVDAVLQTGHLK